MPFWNTKGGSAVALARQVSPEFSQDSQIRLLAALQIVVRRISPRLIVSTVYGLVPFIVSFHDLRLLLRHEARRTNVAAAAIRSASRSCRATSLSQPMMFA